MATRSRIGLKLENGDVKSIYCHWDGYPSWNGKILLTHYQTEDKINELLDLGDISSLNELVSASEGVTHTFDSPAENVTVAYGRDRGESSSNIKTKITSENTFYNDLGEEYNYLFKDGNWYCDGSLLTKAMAGIK